MLKIKDNVDLKELKQYGFKIYENYIYKPKKGEWSVMEIEIDPKTRIISIAGVPDMFHTVEDGLYDIISNNLVEKVNNE